MVTKEATKGNVLPLQAPPYELEIKSMDTTSGINIVDDEHGIVETLVSVTGIEDRVKDIIEPGAYTKTLKSRKPKGILNHDWNTPVSKPLAVKELMPGDSGLPTQLPDGEPWPEAAGALYVKAQYNLNTSAGRDAYENAKFYDQDQEWSIGFNVPKGGATKGADGVRHVKELELYEYSQVLWGAMPNARTQKVKTLGGVDIDEGADEDEDDSEDDVRPTEAGDDPDVVDDEAGSNGDETVKSLTESLIEQKALGIEAIKSIGAFLNLVGVLDDDLLLRIEEVKDDTNPNMDNEVDKGLKYESLADAVQEIAGDSVSSEQLSTLSKLAQDFDDAIDGDDPDQIATAEDALVDTLTGYLSEADSDAGDDLRELVTVLGAMVGVDGSDEGDSGNGTNADPEAGAPDGSEGGSDEPVADDTVGSLPNTEGKKLFTAKSRDKAAKKGDALPDGSFPIENGDDLKNAIKAAGRAKDKAAAKAHIVKRAKELKITFLLPKGWLNDSKNEKADTVQIEASEFDLSDLKSLLVD